tara:strand:+ start:22 stop:318 length:297 start_codon:yes stop_codon:yes gene_type:complete
MGKHKKNKVKKEKTQHVYRTLEQRKEEVRKIIDKLNELQLSVDYEPIKQFYNIMFNYIRTGERTIVNIPFPQMNKRIEGVLATNIREEVALRLKYEKY